MVADRMTHDEILQAYPDLKPKDIDEALRYAAEAVRERELPLRSASRDSSSITPFRRSSRTGCGRRGTMSLMYVITVSRRPTT
jgi:hypothetical protein